MRDGKFTPNDNGSVIRMLSGKYARCNRGRNRILLGAVILSIVTLTMVFGISYGRIRGEELRAVRQAGTAASGMIPDADSSQYAEVRSLGPLCYPMAGPGCMGGDGVPGLYGDPGFLSAEGAGDHAVSPDFEIPGDRQS